MADDITKAAELEWRLWNIGDRPAPESVADEDQADLAQLLTKESNVLLVMTRPDTTSPWSPEDSELLDPSRVEQVNRLADLDMAKLLDLETEQFRSQR